MNALNYACPCDGCKRTYTNEKNLKRHIEALHSGSLKYKCEYCHKALSSKQNLKEHTYIHTGERPYVCNEPDCNASFRQGSQLSAHRRIHGAIRKYSSKVNFVELKVSSRQLTEILKKDPAILIEKRAAPRLSLQDVNILLPPVTDKDCLGPLPPPSLDT